VLRGCRVTQDSFAVPTESPEGRSDPFHTWSPSEASPSAEPSGRAARNAFPPRGEDSADGRRAAHVLAAAEAAAEALLERARVAGERLAREAARQAVAAEVDAFSEAAAQLLDLMQQSCARELARLETDVAGLVADIATKVVGRIVEADDEVVLGVVREALEQAQPGRVLRVAVHPADEPVVRAAQDHLVAVLRSREPFVVVGDESVGRGGAMVETEAGMVDARLETQLETVRRELNAEIGTEAAAA